MPPPLRRSLYSLASVFALASFLCQMPTAAADEPAPASKELEAALREMFAAGMAPGQSTKAERAYGAAKRLSKQDPRVEYAWGLILARQLKLDDAAKQFTVALGPADRRYLPAWRARVWTHLSAGRLKEGLEDLVPLALHLLAETADDNVSQEELETAEWLGRVLKAAELTAASDTQKDLVRKYDEPIADRLTGDLRDRFEAGRTAVEEEFATLNEQASKKKAELEAKEEQKNASKSEQLGDKLEDIEQRKSDSKQSAEDLKRQYEEQLITLDKQLGKLERDYKFLASQAESVDRSMLELRRELTLIEATAASGGGGAPTPQIRNQTNQRNLELRRQGIDTRLQGLLNEYSAISQKAYQVAMQAAGIIKQKQSLAQQYQNATGQIVKQTQELDTWTGRLSKQKQEVEKKQASGKPANLPRLDRKAKSLRTYVDLNIEDERDQLFASFGITANAAK